MNIEFILGLDFSGHYIRLTEIKREADKVTVVNLDQIKTEIDFHDPFLFEMISDPDIALHIVSHLTKLFNRNVLHAKKVAVSISAAASLVHKVPMDKNFTSNEKRNFILWELSNYYPTVSPESFNTGIYSLSGSEVSDSYLMVAVNKEIILFIKNILAGLGYSALRFDIDHFAALKSTVAKALEMDRRNYCLVGFRGNYIDIGKIREATLSEYYSCFTDPELVDQTELLKTFLDGKIEEPCYFYGDGFTSDLVSVLSKHFNLRYYGILDPFQSLNLPASIDLSSKIVSNRSEFAFSVGSVLGLK